MNIWYLNHYATPPAIGIPGRPYALATNLQKWGHNVLIIRATYYHGIQPTPLDAYDRCIRYDGIDYYHIPTRIYQGNGLGRLMNMLDYSRGVRKLTTKIDKQELIKPDVLIPSCVHPLAFPPALFLARKYKAKLIYEVRDIWPLSLVELLGVPSYHPLVLWFGQIEKKAYREADAVVSLVPNAFEHMGPLGLEKRKFHFIPNGIDRHEWMAPPASLPEKHEKSILKIKGEGKLVVLYTGAHGPPNALDQILDLAQITGNKPRPYHFFFIGDGIAKDKLMRRVKEEGISFVSFLPRITKAQVISVLALADVCFVASQKKDIYKYGTSPNKIGDYFMSGKPVLNTLYSAGRINNDYVAQAKAGISVEPYNTRGIETALQHFCAMTFDERRHMGENGRRYVLENLDWEILGRRYALLCESL
jgi:glycosyltransferase involved in cell wall biosynthesis